MSMLDDLQDRVVVAHLRRLGTRDEDGYPFDPRRLYNPPCNRHGLMDCRACTATEPW